MKEGKNEVSSIFSEGSFTKISFPSNIYKEINKRYDDFFHLDQSPLRILVKKFMKIIPSISVCSFIMLLLISLTAMKTATRITKSGVSPNETTTPCSIITSSTPPGPFSVELHSTGLNTFDVQLTDHNKSTTIQFNPAIELEFAIENKAVLTFSGHSGSSSIIKFFHEGSQSLRFDETSLPSSNSGTYLMSVSAINNEYSGLLTTIKIQVGCSDGQRKDYMGCVLNCELWGATW